MYQVKKAVRTETARQMGLTGKGIGVAILDTGIYLHPDFQDRVAAFQDFVGRRSLPYDDNSHGTHIAGVIGGRSFSTGGRYDGMAPGCRLIMVKVLDSKGDGTVANVLAGLRWIRAYREQYNIRIVNISVGSACKPGTGENSTLVRGVDAAWDAGLVVVVAAGNEGPGPMSITTPGISRKVITVGCSDDYKSVEVAGNRIVDYSGRGPTASCICKPDLVAPGSNIVSCNALARRGGNLYTRKSGTSMATPIVSGAIALLLEKEPELTNRDVKLRLLSACDDCGLSRNQQGHGRLNVKKLLTPEIR